MARESTSSDWGGYSGVGGAVGGGVVLLTEKQRLMADRARARVREVVGQLDDVGDIVGGVSVGKAGERRMARMEMRVMKADKCPRCLGRGFLSCMACCD